jgi:hypothetical protein
MWRVSWLAGVEFAFFSRLCSTGWTLDTKYRPGVSGVSFHDPSLFQFKARNTVRSCSTGNSHATSLGENNALQFQRLMDICVAPRPLSAIRFLHRTIRSDSRQRQANGAVGSRSVVPSRHLHSPQWLSANVRLMRQGVLTIGIRTAFRRCERSKTMKTRTNLKAGIDWGDRRPY